jgi:protein TonB
MKALVVAAVVVLGSAASAQQTVYKVGDEGVKAPEPTFDVKPAYTAEAMRAKIQGRIQLEAVVGTDGKAGEIVVTRSLDKEHGLDDNAVEALKQWRFKPGRKDGKVVPVRVEVEMTFVLRDQK